MTVTFRPTPTALAWSHFRTVGQGSDDAHIVPAYALDIPNQGGIVQEGTNFKVTSLTVTVSVDTQGTWVVGSKKTTSLLDHERLHWMMAIIVGNELERAVLALRRPSLASLRQQLQTKFTWYRRTREPGLQRQYDTATDHSRITAQQTQWRTNVTSWYTNRATRDIPLRTP